MRTYYIYDGARCLSQCWWDIEQIAPGNEACPSVVRRNDEKRRKWNTYTIEIWRRLAITIRDAYQLFEEMQKEKKKTEIRKGEWDEYRRSFSWDVSWMDDTVRYSSMLGRSRSISELEERSSDMMWSSGEGREREKRFLRFIFIFILWLPLRFLLFLIIVWLRFEWVAFMLSPWHVVEAVYTCHWAICWAFASETNRILVGLVKLGNSGLAIGIDWWDFGR